MARTHGPERRTTKPRNNLIRQNQFTISDSSDNDVADNQKTPRPATYFVKSPSLSNPNKPSTLTQMLHSEDNESFDDEHRPSSPTLLRRGRSNASTWSNPSLTSDGLSPDTRTSTPSPPPPATLTLPSIVFNTKVLERPAVMIKDSNDSIDPLQRSQTPDTTATAFEAGLGRKRCIAFACGRKAGIKTSTEATNTTVQKIGDEAPKRKSMLTFVCPSRKPSDEAPTRTRKPSFGRRPSPAPRAMTSPLKLRRTSTSSSQSAMPKVAPAASTASRPRRLSTAGEGDTINTERACEFAGTHNEDDDWMKERTCHRNRLTVNDTLKLELGLQKIGLEAEEEEEIEDEEELDNEGLDEDEDDETADDDEDGMVESNDMDEVESDAGFHSDDEGGMSDSDDDSDSDSGSDYHWWAPGRSTAATSYEQLDHMHFSRQRNMSGSSIGSLSSTKANSGESTAKKQRKERAIPIRTRESDLPDSTDFVCGTLDEDRPMEESFRREIELRRAAKHRVCPQDIDPTFPTSDPEMDEEDDEEVFKNNNGSESDVQNGVFGHFEQDDVKAHLDVRGRVRRGRSPVPSPPKRLRSPPPKRPSVLRSPPPRRLFGQSPKRLRSPPPYARLRSPPPTRRQSFAKSPKGKQILLPSIALAERPQQQTYSASLPRRSNLLHAHQTPSPIPDADDSGEETMRGNLPTRGAIDIVKGLEKKRQFRKEKLYQKYCRQRANGTVKPKEEKRCVPGKGAEKMREKGLELAGRWNGEKKYTYSGMTDGHDAQHILSL